MIKLLKWICNEQTTSIKSIFTFQRYVDINFAGLFHRKKNIDEIFILSTECKVIID